MCGSVQINGLSIGNGSLCARAWLFLRSESSPNIEQE